MISPKVKELVDNDPLIKKYPIHRENDYLVLYEYFFMDKNEQKNYQLTYFPELGSYYIEAIRKNEKVGFIDYLGLDIECGKQRLKDIEMSPTRAKFVDTYLTKILNNLDKKGNDRSSSIYMYGVCGAGKTYLANALINELVEKKHEVTYIFYPELVRLYISQMYSLDNELLIKLIKNCEVLAIDDFMAIAEAASGNFLKMFMLPILDHRYRNNLPNIITSNYELNDIPSRFVDASDGFRITKRFSESSLIKFSTIHKADKNVSS